MKVAITLDTSDVTRLTSFYKLLDKAIWRLTHIEVAMQTVEWQTITTQTVDIAGIKQIGYEEQQKLIDRQQNNIENAMDPLIQRLLQNGT